MLEAHRALPLSRGKLLGLFLGVFTLLVLTVILEGGYTQSNRTTVNASEASE